MKLSQIVIIFSASWAFSSCSIDSSASTPAPDVSQNGCVSESDLMKPGIVGGEKVSNFDIDSKKVILLFALDDEDNTSICTSTAIAPNVLLTAAHCISEKHFVVYHSSISCESGFNIQQHAAAVRAAIKHKDWESNTKSEGNTANDVALIILENRIPSSYRVLKIANPTAVDFNLGMIKFIGYGVIDYKSGGSGILRKTEIPVEKASADIANNLVRIDQSNGHGVCSGDSGGPSLVKVNGQDQILGVNSVVGGSSQASLCRDEAKQSLAYGHLSWIKAELSQFGISFNH